MSSTCYQKRAGEQICLLTGAKKCTSDVKGQATTPTRKSQTGHWAYWGTGAALHTFTGPTTNHFEDSTFTDGRSHDYSNPATVN